MKTVPVPTSEVTLAALEVVFRDRGRVFTGTEVHSEVSKRLDRPVNYSGLVKQLRLYAHSPGWMAVLQVEKKGTLKIWVKDTPVAGGLYELLLRLTELRDVFAQLSSVDDELLAEQSRLSGDPLYGSPEARAKRAALEARLHRLTERFAADRGRHRSRGQPSRRVPIPA